MSELTNKRATCPSDLRKGLLGTVSAAVLVCIFVSNAVQAADDDAGQPMLWIELGGQLSRLDEGQEIFAPSFLASRPPIFEPSQKFERLPLYSIDETGSVIFQPENSSWSFSASVRYGRSASNKEVHQQTYPASYVKYNASGGVGERAPAAAAKMADTGIKADTTHLLLDFQAGKDVGLGMFGRDGSSVLNFGVRVAQFVTKSNIALKSDPDWQFHHKYVQQLQKSIVLGSVYHSNDAQASASRSFHGIGPSLSWNASAPLLGNPQNGALAFDWGINAAVLFGRQKVRSHHQTTTSYHNFKYPRSNPRHVHYLTPANRTQTRIVTVPNIGGFAGASFRVQSFKISLGYRADLFFNAIDGGIDARKSENVGFYGPFASVSVGIGG